MSSMTYQPTTSVESADAEVQADEEVAVDCDFLKSRAVGWISS